MYQMLLLIAIFPKDLGYPPFFNGPSFNLSVHTRRTQNRLHHRPEKVGLPATGLSFRHDKLEVQGQPDRRSLHRCQRFGRVWIFSVFLYLPTRTRNAVHSNTASIADQFRHWATLVFPMPPHRETMYQTVFGKRLFPAPYRHTGCHV